MGTDKVGRSEIIRQLMLQIISLSEQVTAMRLALEDAGILTREVKASAMARSQAFWLPRRQGLERMTATDDEEIQQFLRDFEGPVQ